MKIAVYKEDSSWFDQDQYLVDLNRESDGYQPGDFICRINPFGIHLPLTLELAIRRDGALAFRAWTFNGDGNSYLHTDELCEAEAKDVPFQHGFVPTAEQVNTVNGLFSGRIKFEGLQLNVGATVQKICPIDVAREERLTGQTIYLA